MNVFFYRHNSFNTLPYQIAPERIPCNELTFVLKGELNYRINGEPITVKSGEAVCINSGSLRSRTADVVCDYISFNFYSNVAAELPTHITDCLSSELKLLFNVCDDIYSKYNDWFGKLDIALMLIIKLLTDRLKAREENPIVLAVKRYTRTFLSEKISLGEIAKQVGYSPNYLDSIFKSVTGFSVVKYVIIERVNEAKRLIDEDVLSLKDIAIAVGFDDYNYFSRTFKKHSGCSPTDYKSAIHKKARNSSIT